MNRAVWRSLSSILVGLLAFGLMWPEQAHANQARREGLSNNLSIRDDTDLYLFPGLISKYGPRYDLNVRYNFDQAVPNGAALPVFAGSDFVFGVGVNRGQFLNNMDMVDDLAFFGQIYGLEFPANSEIGTFVLGTPYGVGARLSVTHTSSSEVRIQGGDSSEDSRQYNGLEAAVGWSKHRERGFSFDTVAALRFNLLSITEDDTIEFESSGTPSVSIGGRGFFSMSDYLDWVALGNFSLRNYSGTNLGANALLLRLSTGPKLQIVDRVVVASNVAVGLGRVSLDPQGDNNNADETAIALPGFDMALEVRPRDWLDLRWGFRDRYVWNSSRLELGQDAARESYSTNSTTVMSVGAGINYWDFDFDLTANNPFSDDDRIFVTSLSYAPDPQVFDNPPPSIGRPPYWSGDDDETIEIKVEQAAAARSEASDPDDVMQSEPSDPPEPTESEQPSSESPRQQVTPPEPTRPRVAQDEGSEAPHRSGHQTLERIEQDARALFPGHISRGIDGVMIRFDDLFEQRDVAVSLSQEPMLDILAGLAAQYPSATMVIEAYAPESANAEADQTLSRRRARSVQQSLSEAGIDAARVDAIGMGADDQGRVEIIIEAP